MFGSGQSLPINDLLDVLADVRTYPSAPDSVSIVQTHLSIVCLAGDLAYKIKKPVQLPFVDFSTLEARRRACREEVRLNRRLCPATYLGTAALRRTGDQHQFASIGDDESPQDLETAVVMLRLPQERMLDQLLQADAVTAIELAALARQVAQFHATAERTADVVLQGDPDRLAGFAADNFEVLLASSHALPKPLLRALASRSKRAFADILTELRVRAKRGHVVDGHGDLHARNVCMTDPPCIYDCIEFEPSFRCGDVATEVAFLAMDLRYRGNPDLAQHFLTAYVAASRDKRIPILLPILASYRAMVRAKVAVIAAGEEELPASERVAAAREANEHLLLAAAYAIEAGPPCWLVVCGPPASGKSQLCEALQAAAGWPHLATDVTRKQLASLKPTERARAEHYSADFTDRTYAALLQQARQRTSDGTAVVMLDGNFATTAQRAAVRAQAESVGVRLVTAYVQIDAETAQQRAANRSAQGNTVSDAGPTVAAERHASFVPIAPDEGLSVCVLDGCHATNALAIELLTKLLAQP